MTRGHKHYIISTGRNHEYLLEMMLRIFLPAEVFTDFKPTITATFFRNDCNPPHASPGRLFREAFFPTPPELLV
jgi:hypothetical protein